MDHVLDDRDANWLIFRNDLHSGKQGVQRQLEVDVSNNRNKMLWGHPYPQQRHL